LLILRHCDLLFGEELVRVLKDGKLYVGSLVEKLENVLG
jgi:hypothetical protein